MPVLQFLLFNLLSLAYWTYYGVAAVALTPNLLMAAIISGAFYGVPACSLHWVPAAAEYCPV